VFVALVDVGSIALALRTWRRKEEAPAMLQS
jgi:hypothetical protein